MLLTLPSPAEQADIQGMEAEQKVVLVNDEIECGDSVPPISWPSNSKQFNAAYLDKVLGVV